MVSQFFNIDFIMYKQAPQSSLQVQSFCLQLMINVKIMIMIVIVIVIEKESLVENRAKRVVF